MFRRLLFSAAAVTLMAQAPVISFDKTHHDFGRITPDRKVAHKYKVSNTGNAYLSITQVRPSCGCTYTMLGKWSLAPGESTEIEAQFDPKGQKGSVRKSIEVVCNDPKTPNISLTLEAEVVQEIMPSVESVYFHQAPKSAASRSQVRYASGNGETVQILDVKAPGAPFLSFGFKPEGKDVVLEVTFDGRKVPAGQFRGVEQAMVKFSNAHTTVMPLNIQWDLKPAIQSSPAELVFQDAAGKELRQKLTLKQAEGKAFRITGSHPSLQGMRVEGISQKGGTTELTVVLPATVKAGRYSEVLALTTDDPDQPELTVRVVALLK
ncbi:hypothetical protein GETHLI_00720 [Geothrix limicola]|uniref:DUF1573 domain-containing protein n=1 Tax=Geothrix limicola TaxID=2927978 RepID=A0ABQ5QBQ9_9BACT|nr:DUF1573 domain-containing protein [Geothrix limicola]GLH71570.1 hypothetical protein GETHLI_00720 [Geothrix limicola]